MSRASGASIENNFSRGLVSDVTELNFPENSCSETYNCIFHENGKVTRRRGINWETPVPSTVSASKSNIVTEYLWEGAAGQGSLTFVVVQYGGTLRFYNTAMDSLNQGLESYSFAITTYTTTGVSPNPKLPASFSSGNGLLFVTHPQCDPFYVKYDANTKTFSTEKIYIQIRDFDGLPDNNFIGFYRPLAASAPNAHRYNIKNQGWDSLGLVQPIGGSPVSQNVLDYWTTYRNDLPSIADIWWLMKNSEEAMVLSNVDAISVGNTPAPKGHYILNLFNQDRTAASGVPGLPVKTSGSARPSSSAFFAGRIFFSGITATDYTQKIYFSQIALSNDKLGKCYQENDPTSENLSDLLPTDGGVIVIPDMGKVVKMLPFGNELLIFANNGIWSISGNTGVGFIATDYSVKKISSTNCISVSSFVIVAGAVLFWNYDGIYRVAPDPNSQSLVVSSITDGVIRNFYLSISQKSKEVAKGAYDPLTRIVQWLYKSDEDLEYYDRVLNLNVLTGAFYPWTFPSDPENFPVITGIVALKSAGLFLTGTAITTLDGVTITDSDSEIVTVDSFEEVLINGGFRYVLNNTSSRSAFAVETNLNYTDFLTGEVSVPYTSSFVTAYKIHGDGIRKFQSNYVTIFSETQLTSSFFVRGRRSFAGSAASNKFSTLQQGYKHSPYTSASARRLKILGTGLALQLEFISDYEYPFNILGFTVYETANASP